MEPELDLSRLKDLETQLGAELPAIVATLLAELTRAIVEVEAAMSRDDLSAVATAAHAARNSGLMLDARPLLTALGKIEAGAREEKPAAVADGVNLLRSVWPALRRRLEAEAG